MRIDGTMTGEAKPEHSQDNGAAISQERLNEAAQAIIQRLSSEANERVRARAPIEDRWIEALRLFYGKYPARVLETLTAQERSQAFIKLTRHKTNSWAARLSDLLFPTDDSNWGISPTPVPQLVQDAQEAVRRATEATEEANAAASEDPQRAAMLAEQANSYAMQARQTKEEVEEGKRRAANMTKAIEDQFIESQYAAQYRDVIEDACRLGTGILKGPLTMNRLRREWREEDGFFQLVENPDPMPEFIRVDPWHFFPDMSARTIRDSESTYERSLPTRKELRKYAMKLGFNREAIKRLMDKGPDNFGTDVNHIAQLRDITGEGENISGRFVMWEYNGEIEREELCVMLRAIGRDEAAERIEAEEDPFRDYRVIIHFCQNEVLRIVPDYPLDSGETLYSVWNFEKGETSIFGIGVPEIMADSQNAANGAWRMMMDNGALSVGPQIVMDKTKIEPQNGSWNINAMKVWLKTSTSMQGEQPPLQIFNVPNNQQQLAGIIEMARAFADEETSMPMIAQGEQGAGGQTLGGMSMLFNSANVVFRRVVKSFDDDLTTPTVRRAYDWNMQFNPDNSIKGDMQVDARGTSVLLVREIQSTNLMNIMQNWTVHPVIGAYIKVREGLVKTLQTMMIPPNDVLHDQEEADRRLKEAAEQGAQQGPAPEEIRLQIAQMEIEGRIQIAQMNRETQMMKMAQEENISIAQVEAMLEKARMADASRERELAGKVAIENQRAMDAQGRGRDPIDAVGKGIG